MGLASTTHQRKYQTPEGNPYRRSTVEGPLAARLLGGLVLVASGIVLGGWIFGNTSVASVIPGLPTMKFNTALSLALLAYGLLATSWTRYHVQRSSWPQWTARSGTVLAGLLGALNLAQMVTGQSLGIDELFVTD